MRHPMLAIRDARQSSAVRRSHGRPARRGIATPAASCRYDRRTAARPLHGNSPPASPDPITLAAATWLACGIVLLGLTPLPLRDATLGWSPAFWLLVAPAVLLLVRYMPGLRVWHHPKRPL